MKDYSKHIKEVVMPKLKEELKLKNVMGVPTLKKIMVSVGIGTRMKVNKDYSDIVDNVAAITGQRPVVTMSKKAISNFKLRADFPSGVVTTLRRKKMIHFFNRLVNAAFPRIRDFQGFSPKSFDGHGSYSVGIRDCSIFPEITLEDLGKVHGLNITIVTSSKTDEPARALLRHLNFPFKKIVSDPNVKSSSSESASQADTNKS